MALTSCRAYVCIAACTLAVAAGAGCRWGLTQKVDYRIPGHATAPVGRTATDMSQPFGDLFCATLRHIDPSGQTWGPCDRWHESAPAQQQPATALISTELGVIIVAGIFSQCFESQGLLAFAEGVDHLKSPAHGLTVHHVTVSGVGSSTANARQIDAFLQQNPGEYIAIGYSKGIADLMVAIQNHDSARRQIKALVSVAGAVAGSRLADLPQKEAVEWFERAVKKSGIGECEIQDAGGLRSLTRKERYDFLRSWQVPATLRSYSLVGVVPASGVSSVLSFLYERVSYYSLDQDSQVIAEEGIIPGSAFLGVGTGDHWALALPFSESRNPRVNVDRNRYPRAALLEAIVRYVTTP